MARKTDTETVKNSPLVSTFDKQQILNSNRYREQRDLLFAILKDGHQYSHAEVDNILDEFMKGEVK